jgi:hypothetical protein
MDEWADMELLVEYVQHGSDEAFAALVTRYVHLVYSAALRKTGNPDAAGAISAHAVPAAPAGLAPAVTAAVLAKGAVAGGTTSALVKGTLKLMAWTKAKTGIVAGVIVLLAAGTTIVAVNAYQAARTRTALAVLQGDWQGTMAADQVRLRLVVHIFKTNDAFQAVLDSVDQGAKNVPITAVAAGPNFFNFKMPALDVDYRGTLNGDRTEVSGTLKQLTKTYPMTFTRTTEAARVAEPLPADDYAPRAGSDLQGAWEGTLKVGGAELRLDLKIAEPAPGTFHAQMDSVDQGARNLSVTSLTYEKPAIRFEMSAINALFEGTLGGPGDQLQGTWTQLGQKYPLTFRRMAATAVAAAEAAKDYGHGDLEQVQGHWKGEIKAGQTTLPIVFHIALMPDGSYSATMDSPAQGANGIPATTAAFTPPNIRLEWKAISGVYQGTLKNGRLTGTWRQGQVSLSLSLERSAAP